MPCVRTASGEEGGAGVPVLCARSRRRKKPGRLDVRLLRVERKWLGLEFGRVVVSYILSILGQTVWAELWAGTWKPEIQPSMNIGPGKKKPMGSRVRVLWSQTRIRKPDGFNFLPINKPAGRKVIPNPCPNEIKTHQISDFEYPLTTLSGIGAGTGAPSPRPPCPVAILNSTTSRPVSSGRRHSDAFLKKDSTS